MNMILLLVLDFGGTFVFALSGGVAAAHAHMDLFGVLVLAFATGNAGGITRDLLIGATPPIAIAKWQYAALSVAAGLVAFFLLPTVDRVHDPVLWFDAIGLSFCAVVGTTKALDFGLNPAMAALMGMLTGIGGGVLRDVLSNVVPIVLRADLYAVAALAGAAAVACGRVLHINRTATAMIGAGLCIALRFGAIHYGWHLPIAG